MSTKRVLYAEDDLPSRKLLEIKLNKAGFKCDAVDNGSLALQMFTKNNYDLVVLDQYMPGLDGEDVAMEIRKISPDIPLIAITSDDTLIKPLLKLGFNEVIVKPLRGDEVIEIIKSHL
jgi:DNA-binding response OmpR family regulator